MEFHQRNSLANISRESYLIHPQSKLCIVGNPPYNDRTSAVKRKVKEKFDWVDTDVKRRDIGLSFLNSYYKIDADVVVVIHPLSYLIKKTNRLGASVFYGNYSLERHIIFSSHRFEGTVGSNPFPVIMALYVKNRKGVGDVGEIEFETEEGDRFKLSNWDYIGNHISKYPGKERYNPEILFWTMRDINALKRNKTFITTRSNSAVDVDPHKLGYYCYVDLFKRYASVPYWMGNFDVPLPKDGIGYEHLLFFEHVGKKLNPAIFGDTGQPTAEEIDEVKQYINQVVINGYGRKTYQGS